MIIQFFSKKFAETGKTTINSNIVPRVGEVIHINHPHSEYVELMVFDVSYAIKDDEITPIVKCHYSGDSERRLEIRKAHGWL